MEASLGECKVKHMSRCTATTRNARDKGVKRLPPPQSMEILQTIDRLARTHELLALILFIGIFIGLVVGIYKIAMWMQDRENQQLKGK